MKLAQHVLMLRFMRRHMSFEIGPFAIQVNFADRAVHLIPTVVSGDVFVADVLMHEGFVTAGEGAREAGVSMVFVCMVRGTD
jgi:hypothetical protein